MSVCLASALLATLFGLVQDNVKVVPPAAQQPAQGQPAPEAKGEEVRVPAVGSQFDRNAGTVVDIKDYRGGANGCPYIRRAEDVRELDFSNVDFNAPVVAKVNGKDVTQEEFRTWLAFVAGQNGILQAELNVLSKSMIDRIIKNGGKPEDYEVKDEDVNARLKEEEEGARAQGEVALKQYHEQIDSILGMDRYRDFVRGQLRSEKLLLPPMKKAVDGKPPEDPTPLPLEAAELLGDNKQLRDYLAESYAKGNEIPSMFRTQFLRMMQETMVSRASIRSAIDRFPGEEALPSGTFMTVDGQPIPLSTVLVFVTDTPEMRVNALRLLLLFRAIDDALADAGKLITRAEFDTMFEAHEAEFRGTLFPLRNLIGLRGFTSMGEYREYYKRRAAYERMIADTLDDDTLRLHHSQFGKLFYESGRVTMDTIFISLTDAEKAAGGVGAPAWEAAKKKADAAMAALKNGTSFEDVRKEFGSPLPADPSGTLTSMTRNELRGKLGENEYVIFQRGYSLADDVFYNRAENDVVGPARFDVSPIAGLKVTLGYIIAKVGPFRRQGVMKDFSVQKPLVKNDYIDLSFAHFAQECLKNATVELGAAH